MSGGKNSQRPHPNKIGKIGVGVQRASKAEQQAKHPSFDPKLNHKLKHAGEIGKSVDVQTSKSTGKKSFLVKDYGRFKEAIYTAIAHS